MRTSSRELRDLFAETVATPGGEPQPGFTLLLEHRLRALDRTGIAPVAPLAADSPTPRSVARQPQPRPIRPAAGRALRPSLLLAAVVAVVVIASLSLRGGPPASQLHTTHPTPLSPGAGTEPAPDRTAVVSPSPTSVPTEPGTSVPPVVAPPAGPARPSTTAKSSTSTTDSYAPQSIRLTCGAGGVNGHATASCKWSASTASDFARYVVLRTGGGKNRVVFSTSDRGTTSYIDTTLVRGTPYTFLVDALRSDGSVLGHSNVVPVSCCP